MPGSGSYAPLIWGVIALGVAMLIIIYFPLCCKAAVYEPFQSDGGKPVKCPRNSKTFTDLQGNVMCCEGQIVGNSCEGTIRCTLSSTVNPKIPTCAKLRQDYLKEMDPNCKYQKMGQFFETDGGNFCAAQRNEDGTEPASPGMPTCQLYDGPKTCDVPKWWKTDAFNWAKLNEWKSRTPNVSAEEQNQKGEQICRSEGKCWAQESGSPWCYKPVAIEANKYNPNSCYAKTEDDQYILLSHRRDKTAMDVKGYSKENGSDLWFYPIHKQLNQQWKFGDNWNLISRWSGKCLDIFAGNYKQGAKVGQWDCWGGENQQFFTDEEGYFRSKAAPDYAVCPGDNNLQLYSVWELKNPNSEIRRKFGPDFCKINFLSVS